jgi:hypothetical protein
VQPSSQIILQKLHIGLVGGNFVQHSEKQDTRVEKEMGYEVDG